MHRPPDRSRPTRRRHRPRRAAFALAALGAAGALTACQPKPAPTPTPVVPDTYVALGDSGSAGPLIPMPDGPLGCFRSDHNFPHLAASRLPVTRFIDRSCSGATTETMRIGQALPTGGWYPNQLDVLDARTKIVSISIGTNDMAVTDMAMECAMGLFQLRTCASIYPDAEIQRRIDLTTARLRALYQEIHRRAPNATIYSSGGVGGLPETGPGCFPMVPIPPWELDWVRTNMRRLGEAVARVEAETGVIGASVKDSTGHDACQPPDQRWAEPLIPGNLAFSGHANAAGHRALADALVEAVREHQGG